MRTLPRGTAQIVTAEVGPTLPLLVPMDGVEFPVYTGPLGVARLLIRRDRFLTEQSKYGKHWAFLSALPDQDVREWGISRTSSEEALRIALGAYLSNHFEDNESLRLALRRVVESELDQLEQPCTP